MLNQGKKTGLPFRSMFRESGQRNIESAPVGTSQNVLLSQHGLIVRWPQRNEPAGRRELRRTVQVVLPTANGILCTFVGFPSERRSW